MGLRERALESGVLSSWSGFLEKGFLEGVHFSLYISVHIYTCVYGVTPFACAPSMSSHEVLRDKVA